MSDLENDTFRIIEQKDDFLDSYSDILNELLEIRYKKKATTRILAKAFNVSAGNVSSFETLNKEDVRMLFKYAGFWGYRIEMRLVKLTHSEKMGDY